MSADAVDLASLVLPWEDAPPARPVAAPAAPVAPSGQSSGYAQAALVRECEKVASTAQGSRNHQLNVAAFSLGQLVAGGELAESDARTGLADAAQACGLGSVEASRTIDSGIDGGSREPRTAPKQGGQRAPAKGATRAGGPLRAQGTSEGAEIPLAAGDSRRGPRPLEHPYEDAKGATSARGPLRPPSGTAGVVRLADVTPESVDYLWPGRLPLGKMVLVDGDPGVGKTTVALDLAARVSSGANMPDGAPGPGARGVVLLSAEDGLADTVRPRLDAAGADLARIEAIVDVAELDDTGQQVTRPLVIPDDLDHVEATITRIDAALLVVDVLMAYLGGGVDSHKDQDVRRVLHRLAGLAERTGCCVLLLRHLTKGSGGSSPVYRGGGSIGIIGAARAAFLAAPDPDDTGRCVLAPTKMNLAVAPPALGYRLVPAGEVARVDWLGTVEHRAADLLRPRDDDDGPRGEAAAFLRDALEFEPLPAKVVQARAREAGISERTLKRAKAQLGVESVKTGFGDAARWLWTLPSGDDRGDASTSTGSKERQARDR